MSLNKLILAAGCLLALTLTASAQDTSTPYSRYGYGILSDHATSTQRAMGGVGYAMASGRQINVMNPASYANIDSLTFLFDIGFDYTNIWRKEGTTKETQNGGGLDYVTMQFPITRWLGASIGLLPYSSVGYSFGNSVDNGTDAHYGTGGLNELYGGLSARPFKGFTLGANVSYLFGNTHNYSYGYTVTGSTAMFQQALNVRDWNANFGLQYTRAFGRKNIFTVGVTYAPAHNLHGHVYAIQADTQNDKNKPDTTFASSLGDGYSLPNTVGVGLSWTWNQRLFVEADYTYQSWASARYGQLEGWEPTRFVNRHKYALGAQYMHNPRGGYGAHIQYRVGGFYDRGYMQIKGNTVREYGVTAGVGLPVMGYKTTINLGLEWRRRQAYPASLIKEDYLYITLGINFNEMWFWRNKLR